MGIDKSSSRQVPETLQNEYSCPTYSQKGIINQIPQKCTNFAPSFLFKKVPPCVSIKASGKIPETFIGFMWGEGVDPDTLSQIFTTEVKLISIWLHAWKYFFALFVLNSK